jgi:hypothetical protein
VLFRSETQEANAIKEQLAELNKCVSDVDYFRDNYTSIKA